MADRVNQGMNNRTIPAMATCVDQKDSLMAQLCS